MGCFKNIGDRVFLYFTAEEVQQIDAKFVKDHIKNTMINNTMDGHLCPDQRDQMDQLNKSGSTGPTGPNGPTGPTRPTGPKGSKIEQ